MEEKLYYVYLLTRQRNSTFYVGITNHLIRRVWGHKNEMADGFTKRYNIKKLIYFESCNNVQEAILREKQMKRWTRAIKMQAIERMNPEWADLYFDLVDDRKSFESSKEKPLPRNRIPAFAGMTMSNT